MHSDVDSRESLTRAGAALMTEAVVDWTPRTLVRGATQAAAAVLRGGRLLEATGEAVLPTWSAVWAVRALPEA